MFAFETVNSSAGSTIKCPKLRHKSTRRSIERQNYTPIRLEKKFNEHLKELVNNGNAAVTTPNRPHRELTTTSKEIKKLY